MSGPGCVGFFGKLPGVGDFVQRRLPSDFVSAWDADFEAAVAAARATFAADWHAVWQAAPAWRFVLAPGVCGASTWAGVMGPSVDRVGRGFPMVLAAPVSAGAALDTITRAGGGWFRALELAWCAGREAGGASVDAFDATVAALPDPIDWLAAVGTPSPVADAGLQADARQLQWRQSSDDQELAALAHARADFSDGCLWWTTGGVRVSPTACLTRGLPRAETYPAFLVTTAAASPITAGAAVDIASRSPERVHADDLTDLLPDFDPAAESAPAVVATARPEPVTGAPRVAVHGRTTGMAGVVRRREGAATLVAADNGASDPRRQAATCVDGALSGAGWWADPEAVRARVLTLNPALHARREDLIDPIPEDGAVIVACVRDAHASVLCVGAAVAWHWRRGQLRPLCTEPAPPPPDQADTARPGDLLGASPPRRGSRPGLGAAAVPACEDVDCMVAPGDRLVLLATDTLVRVSADVLAASLTGTTGAQAETRIAAAAGLGTDCAEWPLAVIEVGT